MSVRLGETRCSLVDVSDLPLIAMVTGLTERVVRNRIVRTHGNTLLWRAFEREWPNDPESIGQLTVATARKAGLDVVLEQLTGLASRTVRSRLQHSGQMRVATAFPELAADADDESSEEDAEEQEAGDERPEPEEDLPWERYADRSVAFSAADLVGQIRKNAVRRRGHEEAGLISLLASGLRLERSEVQRRLLGWHGRCSVRQVFAGEWARFRLDEVPRGLLAALNVGSVARSGALIRWVADAANVDPARARQAVTDARDRGTVATVLPGVLGPGHAAAAPVDAAPMSDAPPLPSEAEESEPTPFSSKAGPGWSRLRSVAALFAQLGLAVPAEFGQSEFGALIDELELRGFEVHTADGSRLTPLHDAVPIAAELRLRHDGLAAPPVSLRAGIRADAPVMASALSARPSDYELASLRLELLTAGTSAVQLSEHRVAALVDVASAGLALPDAERHLLAEIARVFANVARNPVAVLTSLAHRVDIEDGEALLADCARHRPEWEELHPLLQRHWVALCGRTDAGSSGSMRVQAAASEAPPALGHAARRWRVELREAEPGLGPAMDAACRGDWSQLPDVLSVSELKVLAYSYDGYEFAKNNGLDEPPDLAGRCREPGDVPRWQGSTGELLAAFFGTVRGWRWAHDDGPEDGDASHDAVLALYRTIRKQLLADPGSVEFVVPTPPVEREMRGGTLGE